MAGNKIYRSASGQEIDFQKLILKNETVRAVGNMNVNARGDVLDNTNKTTATRSAQVNKNYRKQIGNVARDLPVATSKKAAKDIAARNEGSTEIVGLDEAPTIAPVETQAEEAPTGGLAAAIAKAREVKQEPQQSAREEERAVDGVKKI